MESGLEPIDWDVGAGGPLDRAAGPLIADGHLSKTRPPTPPLRSAGGASGGVGSEMQKSLGISPNTHPARKASETVP